MGKFTNIFRSPAKKDNTGSGQITPPPPPYNDCQKPNDEKTDLEKDPAWLNAGESLVQQVVTLPTPDPLPAAPDDLITFRVGSEAKEYKRSKAELCAVSRAFREKFRPGNPSADETIITYPKHNPRSYDVIMCWFDTGKLPEYWWEGHKPSRSVMRNIAIFYQTILALEIPSLANDMMDACRKLFVDRNWSPLPSQIAYTSKIDTEKNYLLSFYVDTEVHNLLRYPKHRLMKHPDFSTEYDKIWDDQALTKIIMKKVLEWQIETWDDPRKRVGCHYHDHSEGCKPKKKSKSAK